VTSADEALGYARDPSLDSIRSALRKRVVDSSVPIDAAQVQHVLAVVRSRLGSRRR
jgi:hypothetical protein